MKYVGAHVSIGGGVDKAPLNARKIGAKAFALFTRNQLQWNAGPLAAEAASRFRERCGRFGYPPERLLAHASYLINLGSPDEEVRIRSKRALIEELGRCEVLGVPALVLHPGSHKGRMSEEECLLQIAREATAALAETRAVTAVIENTAGMGGGVGHRYEHLAFLVRHIEPIERVGVCLDTAHLFAAGWDLRSGEAYEAAMAEFDRVVGFGLLRGMHLNDSKVELGSRRDRHESLGRGKLGLSPFRFIMQDSRLEGIPLILETSEPKRWREEIRLLYGFAEPLLPRGSKATV